MYRGVMPPPGRSRATAETRQPGWPLALYSSLKGDTLEWIIRAVTRDRLWDQRSEEREAGAPGPWALSSFYRYRLHWRARRGARGVRPGAGRARISARRGQPGASRA